MFNVFISHKTESRGLASSLKEGLALYGVNCFVAHQDIEPSLEWVKEIEKALRTMDYFLMLVKDNFFDSVWTNQESGYAYIAEIPSLAIRFEDENRKTEEMKGFPSFFQAMNAPGKQDKLIMKLVKIFLNDTRCESKMLEVYIDALEKVGNFDSANKILKLFKYIERISEEKINNIIKICNKNDQIYRSNVFKSGWFGGESYPGLVTWIKEKGIECKYSKNESNYDVITLI